MPLIPRNRGESALHLAAQWGIIPLLAQRHPSVLIPEIFTELRDRRGATPLHWAATGGHLDQVLAVCPGLTADDLDLRDSRGATLLHYAAAGSHLAEFVAHYPRELTPEDFLVPDDDDQTPLADAAHSGQLDHVCPGVLTPENLLKEGLAPPPLELAILGGHLPQVIRLCPGAVTPEILTKGPNLLAAATSGHLTPAHGIDVGVVTATALMVPDDQGVTPLHRAVELGHLDQVLQICPEVMTPENLAVGDNEGITPLHWAAGAAHLTIIHLLCPNALAPKCLLKPSNTGETPLHWAVESGDLSSIPPIDPATLPTDLRDHPILKATWKAHLERMRIERPTTGGAEVDVALA